MKVARKEMRTGKTAFDTTSHPTGVLPRLEKVSTEKATTGQSLPNAGVNSIMVSTPTASR